MGYKCTFMDNDIYYAKDVNAMFANLTSAGVVLSDSGNLLSDLNEAVSEVTTEGVQNFPDSCKLTVVDGIYKIGEGVCFMPDGSAITFDKNGYEISPLADSVSYVYLKRNDTMNTIDVVVSDTAGDANSVPIAEIDASGIIYDRRKYAQAKVKMNTDAEVRNFVCTINGGDDPLVLDVERGDFSRIIVNNVKFPSGNTIITEYPSYHNIVGIQDGVELTFYICRGANYSADVIVYVTKNGSELTFKLARYADGYPYTIDFDIL